MKARGGYAKSRSRVVAVGVCAGSFHSRHNQGREAGSFTSSSDQSNGPFIFVLKPDNTVDLRPVKPGQRQDGDLTVVESGVQPDETVVVTGQLALAPGSKVDPKPYASANSTEANAGRGQERDVILPMDHADEHDSAGNGERESRDHNRLGHIRCQHAAIAKVSSR